MWIVFSRQISICEFQYISPITSQSKIIFISQGALPVLQVIEYELNNYNQIVDARRLPWSKKLQSIMFPCENVYVENPDNYSHKTPLFLQWSAFHVDFHVQKLIPLIHVTEYKKHVENRNFVELVRSFGGVNPLVLRRFLPDHNNELNELVMESIVLEILTEKVKQHKVVYLTSDLLDCVLIVNENWKNAFKRLFDSKVLMMINNTIAFTWMHEEYVKILKSVNGNFVNHVEYQMYAKPTYANNMLKGMI